MLIFQANQIMNILRVYILKSQGIIFFKSNHFIVVRFDVSALNYTKSSSELLKLVSFWTMPHIELYEIRFSFAMDRWRLNVHQIMWGFPGGLDQQKQALNTILSWQAIPLSTLTCSFWKKKRNALLHTFKIDVFYTTPFFRWQTISM